MAVMLLPITAIAEGTAHAFLEELVVTARKREENLQQVPMSVVALSSAQIERYQITSISDLERMTPNITISDTGGLVAGAVSVFMRGVGNDPGFDQGVGIYIDDIYLSRTTGALLETYDIERIEVLKGPQGHLYGRNTIGGAIKYITRRPSEEVRATIEARVGEFDLWQIKTSISGPLVGDTLFGGFGALIKKRDGIQTNTVDGKDYWGEDFQAYRGNLVANLGENFTASLVLDYSEDEASPRVPNRVAVNTATLAGIDFVTTGANRFLAPGTGLYSTPDDASLPGDIDRVSTEFGGAFEKYGIDTITAALTLEWALSESWQLKSVSAGRWVKNVQVYDFDGSSQQFITSIIGRDSDDFSQEFQLNYEGEDINAVIGTYYLDATLDSDSNNVQFPRLRAVQSRTDLSLVNEENLKSLSVYGSVNWDFFENWQLSVGARYTQDKKEVTTLSQVNEGFFALARLRGFPPSAVVAVAPGQEAVAEASPRFAGWSAVPRYFERTSFEQVDGDDQWGEFTPSLKLSWFPSEDILLYAGYSTGFKSGGFSTAGGVLRTFDPETLDTYTLGLKATLSDTLRANVEVFYNDYQGKQLNTIVLQQGRLFALPDNVGEMNTSGAELETVWTPLESLLLAVNVGYLDTQIDAYIQEDSLGNKIDLSDQSSIGFSPRWTAQARVQYDFSLSEWGTLTVGADVAYRDESYANSPIDLRESINLSQVQKAHEIYNAMMTWTSPDSRWRVGLEGKNLDDERVLVNSYKIGPIVTGGYSMPRTWAFSVVYDY